MTFGLLHFAAPWALAALAALPALWWLLRATPPPPARAAFPPTRLLEDLKTEEQSRERAPWWLVLLRALMAALLILGFARPSLAPQAAADTPAGGRTLIVIDDGWTSAPFWPEARASAINALGQAERSGAPVFLLLTAPDATPLDPAQAMTAAEARGRLQRLQPRPWRPDRRDAAERFSRTEGDFARIVWVTDGLADDGAQALGEALRARGPVRAHVPARTARAVVSASVTQDGVETIVRRSPHGAPVGAIAAETLEGRALGAAELAFEGDGLTARARIELPPEIAARAARVRIVGESGAGAVRLLPAGAGRPFVGLADPGGEGQPLLSELYYAERALQPYASLQRGTVGALIDARVQAILLPDASRVSPLDRPDLERWLERGGLLVRFAGPRLANDSDEFLPVRLRPGARSLGGALAWERALSVAPFPEDSPFAGLSIAQNVAVRQQVLAEPVSLEAARVWARLEDNSPLVTAAPRGRGLIVLYHVAAGPSWSDLPLSGLYVEMLRRTLAFAGRAEGAGERDVTAGPFAPARLMDGFGALSPAPPDAKPIAPDAFALAVAGPETPPGLYERAGVSGAIDAAGAEESLVSLTLPSGLERAGLGARVERPLAGWFLGAAALLLALDLLLALYLAGRLPRPPAWMRPKSHGAAIALIAIVLAFGAQDARAQSSEDATLTLRLAYVRSGDPGLDRTSRAGLEAVSRVLRERTSVEPGPPVAVDLARDDLSLYPFLYWPAPPNPQRLSDAALANVDRYLAIGGLLLVDTRDGGGGDGRRPAAVMLAGVDAPPLEPVDTEHVAARAFYLLRGFPGRALSPHLWAETGPAAAARDGVAALFVGDGDWAAAWAGEVQLGGGARQRELALRFGVNIVMVALTGNYKADQVHIPALLDRLGREGRQ